MLLHNKDFKIQNYRHSFKSSLFLFLYLKAAIKYNHSVCFLYKWLNAEEFVHFDCLFTRQNFKVSECSLKI